MDVYRRPKPPSDSVYMETAYPVLRQVFVQCLSFKGQLNLTIWFIDKCNLTVDFDRGN